MPATRTSGSVLVTAILRVVKGALLMTLLSAVWGAAAGKSAMDGLTLFFGAVFLSMLCTLGIAAVGWISVWMVLGLLIDLLMSVFRANPASDPGDTPTRSLTAAQRAMVIYVASSRKRGVPGPQIMALLRKSGWKDQQIEETMEQAGVSLDR